ncbi:MAG: N-acetyltransferase [Cyclobacteriaceae bacterium]|nr:N-acetyltransferase [Cyclobacteriaceae bacterium]
MQIHHTSNNSSKGVFYISGTDDNLAEMTYSKAGEQLIIIDHTEVSDELRGKGAGKQLVMAAVLYARENGIKILPLCPFAKSVFEKQPDIQDVLQ